MAKGSRGGKRGTIGKNAPTKIVNLKEKSLDALKQEAKGTPAEEWYNTAGRSYEQLRSMENIYDLTGTTKNVRGYKDIENDATLSRAKKVLDSAPDGTVVSYDMGGGNYTVFNKTRGHWESRDIIQMPTGNAIIPVTFEKYTPVQAVNRITTMQATALRKTLKGKALQAYRAYLY